MDGYILKSGAVVNARRRALHPIVKERQQLMDSLAWLLGQLGFAAPGPAPSAGRGRRPAMPASPVTRSAMLSA